VGKKKRKRISSEEWAEIEARTDRTLRMLQSRIDYHTAKLREEHGPDYRIPTLEERIAYHEARLREESTS
jgi:hypothetical protein